MAGKLAASVASVVFLIASTWAAQAQQQPCKMQLVASLNMTLSASGRPVIPVTIGGKQVNLLVDTGSPYTALTEAKARELGLRLDALPPQSISMFDGTPVHYQTTTKGFSIGKSAVGTLTLMILPKSHGEDDFDGLLGGDIMSRLDVDFDFGNMKFNLLVPNKCGEGVVYWANSFARIPIQFGEGLVNYYGSRAEVPHIYAKGNLDGKDIDIAVDTGASYSVMTLVQAKFVFGWDSIPPEAVKQSSSGERDVYLYPFKTLNFGGVTVRNPIIAIIDLKGDLLDRQKDMILGMSVMRRLHIYAAYGEKALYVTGLPPKPDAAGEKPAAPAP